MIRKIEAYQEKQKAAEIERTCPFTRILREDLRKVQIDELSREDLLYYSEYDHDKYINNRIAYEKLRRGDYFFSLCKNGRVHTNVTNLNSGRSEQLTNGMRSHLHISGERLVKVDVKNCQPLLLTVLVKKYLVYKEEEEDNQTTTNSQPPPLCCYSGG